MINSNNSNFKIPLNQFVTLLLGYTLIINILKLPVIMANYSLQDSWISIMIAGFYPVTLFILFGFVYKKHPNLNIFQLNRKILGNYVGTFFNVFFYLYIFLYALTQIAGFSMVFADTLFWYYNSRSVLLLLLLITSFGVLFRFKALLKFTQLTLYVLLFLFFIVGLSLSKGSISNISPILQTPPSYLLKGAYYGSYAYSGFEIFLIYIPYIDKPSNYKKLATYTSVFLILIFTWITFLNIFFLGPDVITSFYYPILNVLSSLNIPFFNNFVFIFLSTWAIHCIRNSTLSIFNLIYSLNTKNAPNTLNILYTIPVCILLYFFGSIINDVLTITYFINKFLIPSCFIVLFNVFILFLFTFRGEKHG